MQKSIWAASRSPVAALPMRPGGAVNIFVGIEHLRRCNERIRCQRSAEGATHPVSRTY